MMQYHQFCRRFAIFIAAAKKPKSNPKGNHIDPLSEAEDKKIDAIWDKIYADGKGKGQKKKALAEEDDSSSGKGGFFGSAGFKEFWKGVYDGGKKKFPNPNPDSKKSHPQVTANTLLKSSKFFRDKVFRDFGKWRDSQDTSSKKPAKSETPSVPGLKKDRYKGAKFEITASLQKELKNAGFTPETLADISGAGDLPLTPKKLTISQNKDGLFVLRCRIVDKGTTIDIQRFVDVKKKIIKNDALLVENAPKGTGTRIFSSQVEAARAAGFKEIKCDALTEPPDWVGGKVWPKLGYDGPLPRFKSDSQREEALKILSETGLKPPHTISMLMQTPKGREFWAKNVPRVVNGLTFDLSPSSASSRVLEAYLEKKS